MDSLVMYAKISFAELVGDHTLDGWGLHDAGFLTLQ